MAEIRLYTREDGRIFNEQSGHPHDLDALTTARQREMLVMGWEEDYYTIGMIVSEGDNSVFIPDYIELREDGNKYIKAAKLDEVNAFQHQPS